MQLRTSKRAIPHRKAGEQTTNTLVKAVKAARMTQAITQQELAERSGISIFFIRKFEQGSLSIRLDKLLTILEFLGLELQATSRGTDR